MKRKYVVEYERDEAGWWVASVRGVRGVHTQGRSIRQAERRIREALGLVIGDAADTVELVAEVELPRAALKKVEATRKLAEMASRLPDMTREVVALLVGQFHLSRRDAGVVLGLSHQRVDQLAPRGRRSRTA